MPTSVAPVTALPVETCGKVRYAEQLHALTAAADLQVNHGWLMRYYRCKTCRGWHLTKEHHWLEGRIAA